MKYRFIFTAGFDRDLKLLGKHNPNLRSEVETFLHGFDPGIHPLIPGTGGARKARMAARGRGSAEATGLCITFSLSIRFG